MDLPKDRNGKLVTPGARVRLVTLSGSWVEDLPQKERSDVTSMVEGVFSVEVDEDGDVWIERWWDDGGGSATAIPSGWIHTKWSLSMTPHDL